MHGYDDHNQGQREGGSPFCQNHYPPPYKPYTPPDRGFCTILNTKAIGRSSATPPKPDPGRLWGRMAQGGGPPLLRHVQQEPLMLSTGSEL